MAAGRGHAVTLFETSACLGGRMKDAHTMPNQADLANLLAYLVPEVTRAGVEIVTGVTASAEAILARQPDAVIVATGSMPEAPAIGGDGSVPVSTGDAMTGDACVDLAGIGPGSLMLMDEDGYAWSAAIAEGLLATGRPLIVVTRFFEPWRELPIVSRIANFSRHEAGMPSSPK